MKPFYTMILLPWLSLLLSFCNAPPAADEIKKQPNTAKLKQHVAELKKFAVQQHASSDFAILIDMSLPSWKKRFFVVDMKRDSVLIAGLCCHGQGADYRQEEVVFSNVPGSLCTSEGRYRVGIKYSGVFGTAYKLHGLDTTNNKAYERYVVFHSHSCVPDFEGEAICRSDGCPTVSPLVLEATAKKLDASKKPILMWIYK